MNILGVRVDAVSHDQAREKVQEYMQSSGQHMIFTPNPEMIVLAQKDAYFREVLNKGSLNLCDGKGIQMVASDSVTRIPGVDFFLDLCALAEKNQKTMFFLGSKSLSVLEKTKENVEKKFPGLRIVGTSTGPVFPLNKNNKQAAELFEKDNEKAIDQIIATAPDILCVGFGHGKQEKWMYEFLPSLPSVRIAMGLGGSFDYVSGSIGRAPVWFQKAGFEWLWRLFRQPKRFIRIWNATVRFLWLFYFSKPKSSA